MYKNLLIIVLFIPLFAGTTGKIKGNVIDAISREPILGCVVYLDKTDYGTLVDDNGNYFILNISPGTYNIHAKMIGYTEYIIQNIEINTDLTLTVNIELQESLIELESVIVQASPKLINKNLTSTTAIITDEVISKLPVNEISEILNLQAGFVDGHLRGGRSSEVAYWVDGMPVTDGYDGSTIIDVNKDAVKEMQLISGSFNAEYGQAMSGIVNIVTDEGSNDFGFNMDIYLGDYISRHSDIFRNIENIDFLNSTQNQNFNIQGSIIKDKLFYYISGRHIYYQGVHEGIRAYTPQSYGYQLENLETEDEYWHVLGSDYSDDVYVNNIECGGPLNCGESSQIYLEDLLNAHTVPSPIGDNKFIPMDWNLKKYSQFNLIFKPLSNIKIKYSHFTDNVSFQDYDRYYQLNPDGNLSKYRSGQTNMFQVNYIFNQNSYLSLGIIDYKKEYKHFSYNSLSNYVHSDLNNQNTPTYSYSVGGVNQNRFKRETVSNTFKLDYINQINNIHQFKVGAEYRKHAIFYEDINLQYYTDGGFNPIYDNPFIDPFIDDISSINTSIYNFNPYEFSLYLQDKIEQDELIVNVGLRYDYFNPKGLLLSDPSDPFIYDPIKPEHIYDCSNFDGYCGDNESLQSLEDRLEYWYMPTTSKFMLSPRLGISFPISDQGVIHFSYGHFFQMPKFELLYYNADIDLDRGGTGNIGVIGNPDLKPEKTISYEIGTQYMIDSNSAIDMTLYFRDIRDLTGTRTDFIYTFNGSTYSQYTNSDFAYVKGLVISYKKSFNNGFSFTFDYTFQEAKGTASDPFDAYNASIASEYPEIHVVSLDWDQRHTINTTLYYNSKYYGIGLIGKIGSGQPYTPLLNSNFSNLINNSKFKPMTFNIDFKGSVRFKNNKNLRLYFNIYNLFDHLNHLNVYNDTGRADRTSYLNEALSQNTSQIINSVYDWFNNETFYSSPRRLEIGFRYEFN
tara:strand:+ start:1685 stop:4558 length:2874 start_codon:yes stop_codon:yes gene_type:complete